MTVEIKDNKVYGVFVGSIYEGGNIINPIYTDKNIAILEAGKLLDQEKENIKKLHPDNYQMYGEWKEFHGAGKTIKVWRNLIKEILIYEYDTR
jgi:hypothetical protein